MSKIDDGGPAFPPMVFEDFGHVQGGGGGGITMRDWFAAMASEQDINVNVREYLDLNDTSDGRPVERDLRALARYWHADAMLRARKREDI